MGNWTHVYNSLLYPGLRESFEGLTAIADMANNNTIRRMLQLWVSEEEPRVVYDEDGFLAGLTTLPLAIDGAPCFLVVDCRFDKARQPRYFMLPDGELGRFA
jgi:hypothetical protein